MHVRFRSEGEEKRAETNEEPATGGTKPNSRRTVFDASFGLYSLNKNTPEKAYHDAEYEFHFPKIDNLADIIAQLGSGCFLWKRDLSRFFLQLKIDPYEYDKLGFVGDLNSTYL